MLDSHLRAGSDVFGAKVGWWKTVIYRKKKNMTLLSKQYVTRLFFKVESPLKFHLSLLKILNMEAFFSRVVLVQQWSFYLVLQFQALFQFTWNENMPSHILQCSKTPASNFFEIVQEVV